MNLRVWALTAACALGAVRLAAQSPSEGAAPVGPQSNVVFTQYSSLSSVAEIVRRMLSPLEARRATQAASRSGKSMQGQALDLANERFSLYVPRKTSPQGYSLLVFVSPYEDARIPFDWISALDRHDMIFVSAARSGNSTNVFDRREPLALLGAVNVMSRYAIDPRRIYVAGFSGGSRVAERLAIGYPELFHGGLLLAGSDPPGEARLPLPPADIFARFQESGRLVYASGSQDTYHLAEDGVSRRSMSTWCVFDVAGGPIAGLSHELPDGGTIDRLLDELDAPRPPDPAKLAACRAQVDASLDAALRGVQDLAHAGKLDKARDALGKLDTRFGGLAAPRSVELAESLNAP
jgi:pimeloyl-ACP methyl ester carboxylesterase